MQNLFSIRSTALFVLTLVKLTLVNISFAEVSDNDPANKENNRISNYILNRAKLTKTVQPRYPKIELGRGIEGWVVFSVIVDSSGNVKDPIILSSSGRKNFETKARKAIKKFKYQPATLNGKAIESSDNKVVVNFSIAWDKPGANQYFLDEFDGIREKINTGHFNNLEEELKNLKNNYVRNRYEQALFYILTSDFYLKTENTKKHIHALNNAIEHYSKNLPVKLYASNLVNLYNAQIKQGKIKSALNLASKAEELIKDVPNLSHLLTHRDSMVETLSAIPLLHTSGTITEGQLWAHDLMRNHIGVELKKGKLNQIEFRCANKIRRFEINEDNQSWKIPKKWEDCTAFISGEKGSQFELLEQA